MIGSNVVSVKSSFKHDLTASRQSAIRPYEEPLIISHRQPTHPYYAFFRIEYDVPQSRQFHAKV